MFSGSRSDATEEDPNCNGSGKPAPNDVTSMDVIKQHFSPASSDYPASEANAVINNV
jgi:hypothetical protein